jgi:hypothetical protein
LLAPALTSVLPGGASGCDCPLTLSPRARVGCPRTPVAGDTRACLITVGSEFLSGVGEPRAELVVLRQVEYGGERSCPTVAEQFPAILDAELGVLGLEPGLVEELEVSPIVQLPDDGLGRKSDSSGGRRARPVLAHPRRVDDERARLARTNQVVPWSVADLADDWVPHKAPKSADGLWIRVDGDELKACPRRGEVVRECQRRASSAEADDLSLGVGPDAGPCAW